MVALLVASVAIPAAASTFVRYEAEEAVYQASGLTVRDNALIGFKNNPQAFVSFTVSSANAGAQTVKVLYTAEDDCTLTVLANGERAGEVTLTKGETQIAEVSATLVNGENKIVLWNEKDTVQQELMLQSIEVGGTEYHATQAFYQMWGMTIDASHAGYSGSGFVAGFFMNCGSHIQFTVDVTAAGEYDVTVGYACGINEAKGQSAKLGVYVNGDKQKDTLLQPGEQWNTYLRKTEQLTLKAGTNTITYWYEDAAVVAAPNFDYIEIAAKGTASDKDPTIKTVEELIAEHNKTVLPFTVTPNKGMTMEAEEALWVMGDPHKNIAAVTEHSGYTGSGFVAGLWNNPGAGVEFPLEVMKNGTYAITVRYANGANPAAVGVYVDGELLDQYDFVSSGGWSNWSEFTVEVALTTETTSVKLLAAPGEGEFGINLDNMSVEPVEIDEPEGNPTVPTDPTDPSEPADPTDPSNEPEPPTQKPTEATKPTTTPDSGSTNVDPEEDNTLVLVIVAAVLIPVLAAVAVVIIVKARSKKG